MRIFLIIGVCLCLIWSSVSANDSLTVKHRYNNSVSVSALGIYLPKTYHFMSHISEILSYNFADQYSFSYERRVWRNIFVGGAYAAWDNRPYILRLSGCSVYAPIQPGSFEWMEKYQFADLYAAYKLNYFRRHKFTIGAGLSYAQGVNTIADTVYYYQYDGIIVAHREKASYYGLIASASYDYLIFHDRLSMGYGIKLRKYPGLYSTQLDYGFNFKFNF